MILNYNIAKVNTYDNIKVVEQGEKMDTRQELEERLESILSEIAYEVQIRKGGSFNGELSDAISMLKEAKDVLKTLNSDNYIDEDEEELDEDFTEKKRKSNRKLDLDWEDDYEDGY
jgi:hypothetical protein